jgi:phage tail sheath protein FI
MSRFTIKRPGIFIEEISTQPKPIEGVSTSTAAFLGETQVGATAPTLVTSWLEFQTLFGGYFGADKYLPYAVESFFLNGGKRCYICKVTNSDYASALAKLEAVEEVSIVYSPDAQSVAGLADALISHCERLRSRFAIFDSLKGQDSSSVTKSHESSFVALYYPWIYVKQTEAGQMCLVPPGGHVAGIYARNDIEKGVDKAPANQIVKGVVDLELTMKSYQQDSLILQGINCIRKFEGREIRVWGARTLSSDPEWKYVNVRRLMIYLEQSIKKGTAWVTFEPNNAATWAKVKAQTENFLTQTWEGGMLMGTSAKEAYFVHCDQTTMNQNDVDNGRINIIIGVAVTKPAEFMILRITQSIST